MTIKPDNNRQPSDFPPRLHLVGTDGVTEWSWGSGWLSSNLTRPANATFWEMRLVVGSSPRKFWNRADDVRFDGHGLLWIRDHSIPDREIWIRFDPPAGDGATLMDPWGGIWVWNDARWNCIQNPHSTVIVWKRAANGWGG